MRGVKTGLGGEEQSGLGQIAIYRRLCVSPPGQRCAAHPRGCGERGERFGKHIKNKEK